METTEERVIRQLKGIKNALFFGGFCLAALVGINVYFVVDDLRENTERRLGRTFYEQADTLSRNASYEELLELSLERQRTHPRDSNGYFFAGVAHVNLENFDQAVIAFNKAVELRPEGKNAIDQWLEIVRQKRAEKTKGAPGEATRRSERFEKRAFS